MPIFTIQETVVYEVDAATAQEAHEKFIQNVGKYFLGASERIITDEMGEECDFDEQG